MKRLRILIWPIHGRYLHYLVQSPHEFFLPVKPGRPEGYAGRGGIFTWPESVYEVPAEAVRDLNLDLIVYQTPKNYFEDQMEILSVDQRRLPGIYLEHDAPRNHPTDMRHPIDDPNVLLVHVTHFNRLMWDSGRCPARVIEHGVKIAPDVKYTGELDRGIVVVNSIEGRQRIAGFDIYRRACDRLPLDLASMESLGLGGLGDIPHVELHRLEARYRFFFSPIRYTSMPLALVEAMAIGLPIVALATTELPMVVENGVSGFVSNDLDYLFDKMQALLHSRDDAVWLGMNARESAKQRFPLERFLREWDQAYSQVLS